MKFTRQSEDVSSKEKCYKGKRDTLAVICRILWGEELLYVRGIREREKKKEKNK